MHITDWNDAFLSEFDPKTYVEMLRLAQVKSSVVVAQSHVGIANFPTQVGRAHRAMKDRPNLGQVIDLCHQSGIGVQLYYSVIFDRWAYDNHPEWRMILVNGKQAAEHNRQGFNCPNSPYRDYVAETINRRSAIFKATPEIACEMALKAYSKQVGPVPPLLVKE